MTTALRAVLSRLLLGCCVVLAGALALASAAHANESAWRPPRAPVPRDAWRVTLEVGPLWTTRNDVRIPGDTGTDLALDDLTGSGAFFSGRAWVDWRWRARHAWRLTAAPLSFSGTSTLARTTDFAGTTFAAGAATEGSYRFDTYRLTYRYLLHQRPTFRLHVGGTLLVRSAEIELRQGALSARKTDLGLVPLLHVDAEWCLAPGWRLTADLDGLAAPQGRAFDLGVNLHRRLSRHVEVGVGYRTIEGGADNDEVYTFAWTHAAVATLSFTF